MIKVTNNSSDIIKVAINQWGEEGSTDFFSIESNESDSWDRSSNLGYVMAIQRRGSQATYYVLSDSEITVDDTSVKDNGRVISPNR
jgi:hypothetical protein